MRHLTYDEACVLQDELMGDTYPAWMFDFETLIADNARLDDDGDGDGDGELVPTIDELRLMLGRYATGPVCTTATELEAHYADTLSVCGVLPGFYDLSSMVYDLAVVLPDGKYVGVSGDEFWETIQEYRVGHDVEAVLHEGGNWTTIVLSSEADLAQVYRRDDAPELESAMQYSTVEELVREHAAAGYMIRMP